MTGFIMEDSLRGALVAGGYPIAYKPFDIESVLDMVEVITAEKVK